MTEYLITPVPKPRQTYSDRWRQRPSVMRFRAFADKCRALKMELPESGAHATFVMPMPKSWSKKKKALMDGTPHKQVADVDNLLKSLADSLYKDDSHIWDIRITKLWGREGKIIIRKGVNL